jgi:pyruvate/2-oxoglutarate dehydrogenase complex dihydrolipoamide dehydrogenase (E3) component
VRTNTTAAQVRHDGADTVVQLDGGDQLRCDVIVVGTGRSPRAGNLRLETVGVQLGERGEVTVDQHCRAAEGVWGIGDVTGVMPFTHVAMYQGRIVVDNILGSPRTARYEGIPRVVFSDLEVAAVGLTGQQVEAQGRSVVGAEVDLTEVIARPWTYEKDPRGHLGVLADRDRRVLLGAWAVGPQASEWIHTAALAVREQIPIDRLLDQVAQFRPTTRATWKPCRSWTCDGSAGEAMHSQRRGTWPSEGGLTRWAPIPLPSRRSIAATRQGQEDGHDR